MFVKTSHSHVVLIMRRTYAAFVSHTHILSLSSAHVLKVWTQRHVGTDSVVVTTCCVERQHKVYCTQTHFTDVLKMINFIDHTQTDTHRHGGEAKWEQHGSQFYSASLSKLSIISFLWTNSQCLFCVFVNVLMTVNIFGCLCCQHRTVTLSDWITVWC